MWMHCIHVYYTGKCFNEYWRCVFNILCNVYVHINISRREQQEDFEQYLMSACNIDLVLYLVFGSEFMWSPMYP